VAQRLTPLVSRDTREVLERLYPEARELFEKGLAVPGRPRAE
jgi:hypothetical protein